MFPGGGQGSKSIASDGLTPKLGSVISLSEARKGRRVKHCGLFSSSQSGLASVPLSQSPSTTSRQTLTTTLSKTHPLDLPRLLPARWWPQGPKTATPASAQSRAAKEDHPEQLVFVSRACGQWQPSSRPSLGHGILAVWGGVR